LTTEIDDTGASSISVVNHQVRPRLPFILHLKIFRIIFNEQ